MDSISVDQVWQVVTDMVASLAERSKTKRFAQATTNSLNVA
jgi:hypothetical protein